MTTHDYCAEWNSCGSTIENALNGVVENKSLSEIKTEDIRAALSKLFPSDGLKAYIKSTYNLPNDGSPEQENQLNSAWRMYAIARWKSNILKQPGETRHFNVIGRLHKPNIVEGPDVSKTTLRINLEEGLYWSLSQGQHHISFMEFSLNSLHWAPFVNDAWLLGGINGGKSFLLLSPLSYLNLYDRAFKRMTVTGREAVGLDGFKYTFKRGATNVLIHCEPGDPTTAQQASAEQYVAILQKYPQEAGDNAKQQEGVQHLDQFFTGLNPGLTIHDHQHVLVDEKNQSLSFSSSNQLNGNNASEPSPMEADMIATLSKKVLYALDPNKLGEKLKDLEMKEGAQLDLAGSNLQNLDLSGFKAPPNVLLNFRSTFFQNSDLSGVNFDRADLRWANLTGAKLSSSSSFKMTNIAGSICGFNDVKGLNSQAEWDNAFMGHFNKSKNLLVRDTFLDNGSPVGGSAYFCNSPDIFVTQSDLSPLAANTVLSDMWNNQLGNQVISSSGGRRAFQNHEGNQNYVYARLENIGTEALTPYVMIFYRNFSTTVWAHNDPWVPLSYEPLVLDPANFVESGTSDRCLEPGERALLGPLLWMPPQEGIHYCFMCCAASSKDEFDRQVSLIQESVNLPQFAGYVNQNSNVCWRNTADLDLDKKGMFSLLGLSEQAEEEYQLRFSVPNASPNLKVSVDGDWVSYSSDTELVIPGNIRLGRGEECRVFVSLESRRQVDLYFDGKDLDGKYVKLDFNQPVKALRFSQYLDANLIGSVNLECSGDHWE